MTNNRGMDFKNGLLLSNEKECVERATTWTDLKKIMLSERSQTKEYIYIEL